MNAIQLFSDLEDLYLEYANSGLTFSKFAESKDISCHQADILLDAGKEAYEFAQEGK